MRPPVYLVALAAGSIIAGSAVATTATFAATSSAAQGSAKAQDSAKPQNAPAVQDTADAHLNKAQAILDSVPAEPKGTPLVVTKDDDKQEEAAESLAKLKQRFAEMIAAYRSAPDPLSTAWKLKFSEVERELARIIGGGSSAGSMTGAAATEVVTQRSDGAAPSVSQAPSVAMPGAVGSSVPGASGARTVGAPAAGPPTQGLVPTTNGTLGAGDTAPPGSLAVVPAPGTPAAAGGDAHPGTPAVLTVVPASPAAGVASQDTTVQVAAAKVSMVGIKELDPGIRRQLEMFRVELELFYIAPPSERSSS